MPNRRYTFEQAQGEGRNFGHALNTLYRDRNAGRRWGGPRPEFDQVTVTAEIHVRSFRYSFYLRYDGPLHVLTIHDYDAGHRQVLVAEALETFYRCVGYAPHEMAHNIEAIIVDLHRAGGLADGRAEVGGADAADAFTYGHLEAAHRQLRAQVMATDYQRLEAQAYQQRQQLYLERQRRQRYGLGAAGLGLGMGMMWVDDPLGMAAEAPKPIAPDAAERGMALFKAHLTPRQRDMVEAFNICVFRGGDSKEPYFLCTDKGTSHNIVNLHGKGKKLSSRSLCFKPNGGVCQGDVFVGQKMALETRESETLKVANIHNVSTYSVARLQQMLKFAEP